MVKTLARFTTEKTIKTLGDASDKILLKLPAKLAESWWLCRLRLILRRYSLSRTRTESFLGGKRKCHSLSS